MRDQRGFCAISDYGFLSDCRSAALVADDGSVDWLCWPDFDSPSVFGALLDPDRGGRFQIRPDEPYRVARSYLPQTNVLETRFHTDGGDVTVTDWLHVGARRALCRRAHCTSGRVRLRVVCDPRPGYGATGPVRWTSRFGWLVADAGDGDTLVLDGVDEANSTVELAAGECMDVTLGWGKPGPSDPHVSLRRARRTWRQWAEGLRLPAFAAEHVERSALVLKGLQYRETGAIIAAATTSLPEVVGGQRNYDYRFSWLRDATFTLYALRAVGRHEEADSWFDWLKAITLVQGADNLQIMYGIHGQADLAERELGHLSGWRDSRPVRVGNAACSQRQIDVYGEVNEAIWLQWRSAGGRPLSKHRWALVAEMARRAEREWAEPDEGIWEVRGEPKHFVYSKVMCWVALDRAIRLARLNPHAAAGAPVQRWRAARDTIREQVLERGYDANLGAFTQSYGSGTLDASNLLLAQVGFIDGRDPRFIGTVRATQRHLVREGLVDRYRPEETDDGFDGVEATFAIASAWLSLALVRIGDTDAALDVFERMVSCANDLGLMSEEITPQGSLLGNFPQAFTHIAIIACAFALEHALARRDVRAAA